MAKQKSRSQRIVKIALAVITLTWATPVRAQTAYYKSKTITMVQGRAPGGQGDIRVRALLPILQKNLPGNPTIVSEYMDGRLFTWLTELKEPRFVPVYSGPDLDAGAGESAGSC